MLYIWNILSRRNAAPTCGLFEPASIVCRVGLTDIDPNLHLNNAKYVKYMDLARLETMLSNGLMWRMLRAKANPVVTNTEISHIRELRTWQRFTVSSRLLGFDDKYLYSEQRFIRDGTLCAHAFSRLACVQGGKSRPVPEVFASLGIHEPSPPLPEPVLLWKDLLEAKKRYAAGTPTAVIGATCA